MKIGSHIFRFTSYFSEDNVLLNLNLYDNHDILWDERGEKEGRTIVLCIA